MEFEIRGPCVVEGFGSCGFTWFSLHGTCRLKCSGHESTEFEALNPKLKNGLRELK